MLLRRSGIFLAGLLLGAAAWATLPSEASIDELLEASQLHAQITQSLRIMEGEPDKGVLPAEIGLELPPAMRQRLQTLEKQIEQAVREEMAWERIRPLYHRIYKETLTQEEVNALLAFYRTPVGRSIIQKMPLLMQRSMQVTREQVLPNVNQRMGKILADTVKDVLGSDTSAPTINQKQK